MAWADDYAIAALNASAPLLADGDAMTDVTLVGASGAVAWSREADALRITVPEAVTAGLDPELPLVFRIHVDGATADECDAASARYRSAIHAA